MHTARKAILRFLGRSLSALLTLLLLAFLVLIFIVGQPQDPEQAPVPAASPLPAASPVRIQAEKDLPALLNAFPAPVMSFMSGSGMNFVSGSVEDAAWRSGFARVLTLTWRTADGQSLILRSICPADALELIGKGDYAFSAVSGPALFGQPTVRMENRDTVRIHTAASEGLYALTAPLSMASSLSSLTRSIQLFRLE